jgi:hypothetical protein
MSKIRGAAQAGFARRQMNAALRIYRALGFILMRDTEILNAAFICRRKEIIPTDLIADSSSN